MPNRALLQREAPRTAEQQDEWRCEDGAVVAVEVPCRTIKRHRENWRATKGQEERTQRTACMCKMCWGDGEASWRPSSLGKHPSLPRLPWLLPRRLHIRTWAPQSSEESTGDVTSEEGNSPSFSAWIQYGFIYSGILFLLPISPVIVHNEPDFFSQLPDHCWYLLQNTAQRSQQTIRISQAPHT